MSMIEFEPLEKLRKDQRAAAGALTTSEVRYLVDLYYQVQEFRKAAGNQIASMTKAGESAAVLNWTFGVFERIEKEIQKWMDVYTLNEPSGMGKWARDQQIVRSRHLAGMNMAVDRGITRERA